VFDEIVERELRYERKYWERVMREEE